MATKIVTKSGSGAPTTDDLIAGELAVDLTNKRLYTENSGGTVIEVGSNPYNFTANHDGSAKLATTATGIDVTGSVTASAGITATTGTFSGAVTANDGILIPNGEANPVNAYGATTGGSTFAIANTGGTSYFGNESSVAGTLATGTSAYGTVIGTGAARDINFFTSGATRLTIASTGAAIFSGLVGIGTSSPSSYPVAPNLVVDAGTNGGITIKTGSSNYGGVYFADGTTGNEQYRGSIQYSHDYAGVTDSMQFSTSGAEKMRIDVSGNVGIGAAPSAWASAYKVLQLGSASSMFNTGSSTLFATNAYIDSGFAWRYQNSSYSSRYTMESGGHAWYTAPSGTAGDAVGFTQAMTLDASGNLGIGTASLNGLKTVIKGSTGYPATTGTTQTGVLRLSGGAGLYNVLDMGVNEGTDSSWIQSTRANSLGTYDKLLLNPYGGSVGIGTSSPATILNTKGATLTTTTDKREILLEAYDDGATNSLGALTGVTFRNSPTTYTAGSFNRTSGIYGINLDSAGYGRSMGLALYTSSIDGTATEKVRIDASGNVEIFAENPANSLLGQLSVKSTSALANGNVSGISLWAQTSSGLGAYASIQAVTTGDYTGNLVFTTRNGIGTFGPKMTITASGSLLVGCTSEASATVAGLSVNSAGYINSSRNTTGLAGHHQFFNPNGVVGIITTSGTSTSYTTSSDQRLKENIVDSPSASDDIDAIQVRSFDWKADGSHQKYGMVAQELATVAPIAVNQPEDPDEMMGVDYSKLVPMMLKEIQSLRARIAALES